MMPAFLISLKLVRRLRLVGAGEGCYSAGGEHHGEEGGGYEKIMHRGCFSSSCESLAALLTEPESRRSGCVTIA